MPAKRKFITVTVTLSVDHRVTKSEARRELRTRVNDGCCYSLDEDQVRVRKAS